MFFLIFILALPITACHDWRQEERDWHYRPYINLEECIHEVNNDVRNPIHCQFAPFIKQILDIKKSEVSKTSHILEPRKNR